MGILNVTPDSFSDGGKNYALGDAIEAGLRMVRQGADLLDIGGESTRPGSDPVEEREELRRVIPVVEALAKRTAVPLSVDTRKARVAEEAIDAGAAIVNDVSALRDDLNMAPLIAQRGTGVVLMHMQGTPRTMQTEPRYGDVVREVREFLRERARFAQSEGIASEAIAVDPGLGFGKTFDHNLSLVANLEAFRALGHPLVVGHSRKGFVGKLLGDAPIADRAEGSVVVAVVAAAKGADVLRVHDVEPTVRAFKVAGPLLAAALLPGEGDPDEGGPASRRSGLPSPGETVQMALRGLSVQARIGASEAERARPQRLLVDIEWAAPLPRRDALEDAVDYARVAADAESVLASKEWVLLETASEAVRRRVGALDGVRDARVSIRKPSPPGLDAEASEARVGRL
jgi:dihydropteroate synthase